MHEGGNYLWGHEFRRAAKGTRTRPVPHFFFAEPIIGDFDVAIEGQKDIVKFEIAVYNSILMKVL